MPVRNVLNVDTVDRFVDRVAAHAEAPAELLRESRFDVGPAVRRRHGALRRLVNQRKAHRAGRRAAASESHRYLRRLLDGWQEEQVV